jgi:hypothetical protein
LASYLPGAVSVAVQCTDEPYHRPLEPGDVEVRFRELGPYDVSGMDVVIEVRSKWFPTGRKTVNGAATCCARW